MTIATDFLRFSSADVVHAYQVTGLVPVRHRWYWPRPVSLDVALRLPSGVALGPRHVVRYGHGLEALLQARARASVLDLLPHFDDCYSLAYCEVLQIHIRYFSGFARGFNGLPPLTGEEAIAMLAAARRREKDYEKLSHVEHVSRFMAGFADGAAAWTAAGPIGREVLGRARRARARRAEGR